MQTKAMVDFVRSISRAALLVGACSGMWLLAVAAGPSALSSKSTPPLLPGQSATLLANGEWLLLGGRSDTGGMNGHAILVDRTLKHRQNVGQSLSVARSGHTATVLPDGTVLVIGGSDRTGQLIASIERYFPETKRFESYGDVGIEARTGHSAVLLSAGELLIVGGMDVSARVHDDAKILDPRTLRSRDLNARMAEPRRGAQAQLQANGEVLITGGYDQSGALIASAESFDVAISTFRAVDGPATVAAERTVRAARPKVTATVPDAGSTNVSVDTRFTVRFSKPLLPETLTHETVTLLGPSGLVSAKVAAAEGGVLVFLTPQQPLLPGSPYTLFVQGASDASDEPLPFTAIKFQTSTITQVNRPTLPVPEQTPVPENEPVLDDNDGELWLPAAHNLTGNWRSGLGELQRSSRNAAQSKQKLPTAPQGVTAVAGRVLKLNSAPLRQVTLSIGGRTTTTDANGNFLLMDVPAGAQTLVIDGRTADSGKQHYGRYEYRLEVAARKTTTLPFTVWMTRLDTANELNISSPTTSETVLTNPRIPGLELRIPAGTVIRDAENKIVTQLSMTAIPIDQPPFPLPSSSVPVYFTIQPGGGRLQGLTVDAAKGARLIYPNFSNNAPGTRVDFWNYDARDRGWYVYGQGTVSADGKQIVPDPGVVIYEFTGAMVVENGAPPMGPVSGDDNCDNGPSAPAQEGDPVDCYTGLFVSKRSDLSIFDVLPLEVIRTYRQLDSGVRAFGIGTTLAYDMFLYGTTVNYTFQDLILPDGGRVHYPRISAGNSWTDAVYKNTTTPGRFYGSTIRWDVTIGTVGGWLLELRDGTDYIFPEAAKQGPRCGALIGIRDRNGNEVKLNRGTRAEDCVLREAISPNGHKLTFSYDSLRRISQVSDDAGRSVSYAYDTAGRLISVTDPANRNETYAYDTQNRMVSIKDKRGNTMITNTYNAAGRVIGQTYADNSTSSFSYVLDANGRATQMDYTNERGFVKRVQFNASGLPITVTRALGRPEQQTLTIVRDPTTNLPQTMTDELGRVTAYTYDAKANLTQLTRLHGTSAAQIWNYSYEPTFSQLASVTDPANRTTTYHYDANGNLTKVADPLGHEVTMTYNAAGQMTSRTVNVNGSPVTNSVAYVSGLLETATDPLGRVTRFFRDAVGRVVTTKDPSGGLWRTEYDAVGRATKSIDPLGQDTQYTYDNNDNPLTFEDQRGNVTSFTYDARNRVATRIDPLLNAESYLYDETGNQVRVTDREGQVSGYAYDGLDRLTRAGFGATVSSPTSFASVVAYTWDNGDRLTGIVDSISGTVGREFDGLDRLTQEQSPQGSISYTYYANGLRQTMMVAGQPGVNYVYDPANRLTQIAQGSATVGFSYDSMNRRTSMTLVNGIQASYSYDDASQLTGLTYQNGGVTLGNLTYAYDVSGRRVAMGGSFARLTLPAAVTSTTYDAANRLTTWGNTALSYNHNGALISETGTSNVTYMWDEREHLRQIREGATMIASFTYDGIGRRAAKSSGGATTRFLLDGWQPVQELNQSGPTANVLTGVRVDEILRRSPVSGQTEDFLTDALGSALALTSANGAIQTTYQYGPYGSTSSSGTSNNAYQYIGRENDGGLYYLRNRYYSPAQQRFISEDPIGLAGGSNVYAYVLGDPINNYDPFGLETAQIAMDHALPSPSTGQKPCKCDPRLPDYVQLELDIYVFSFSGTATGAGDWYMGYGANRTYPGLHKPGGSASFGWFQKCSPPGRKELDGFLRGYSFGGGIYRGLGGSISGNSSGKSISIGAGIGGGIGGVNPGHNAHYGGNVFGDRLK